MDVLQLCCFTNYWSPDINVESHDLRLGKDIFKLPQDYGKKFDLIVSAPPCDQFTKANAHSWLEYPSEFIEIALHCFIISIRSGRAWWLENPPGRIETFIPELKEYRLANVRFPDTNKEYIIYGNTILLTPIVKRYGHSSSIILNASKKKREAWHPMLVELFERSFQ